MPALGGNNVPSALVEENKPDFTTVITAWPAGGNGSLIPLQGAVVLLGG